MGFYSDFRYKFVVRFYIVATILIKLNSDFIKLVVILEHTQIQSKICRNQPKMVEIYPKWWNQSCIWWISANFDSNLNIFNLLIDMFLSFSIFYSTLYSKIFKIGWLLSTVHWFWIGFQHFLFIRIRFGCRILNRTYFMV